MAASGTIGEILTALSSPSWAAVRDAVDQAGDLLRAGAWVDAEVAEVGGRLVELAEHPKWEVRKAVAHAVQYLHHETFHAAVARLLKDDNSWVRDAAHRSLARRTELTRADILKEQHGDLLLRWLSDLEARHGPRARQDALHVAERFAELLVREARHEIVKVVAPLDVSLLNLETSLGRTRIDRDACHKHVARARERLRLLTAIVDSLRDLTAEVTPEFRGEGLREVMEEAVALVKDRMRSKGDRIAVEVTIDSILRLDAHRHRLLQAFSNIVQNAFEAYDGMDTPGKIRMEAHVEGEHHVVLTVADNGCGMSEEALRDACRLYASKKPDGTGFGLPLAKKIIETEHGGSIKLTSAKGEGTTVTVVLPLEQEQRQR
ncbi:MAG: HEAT repeat domain-containing protein [Deltaproteobacteria bacterium]|nr:HEAT repeat domain-containing protein [Deltaproteobacteria bacterium]